MMDVACIRALRLIGRLPDMLQRFPRLQLEQPASYTAQLGNLVKLEGVRTGGRIANGCKR